jgi:hypothetical protein
VIDALELASDEEDSLVRRLDSPDKEAVDVLESIDDEESIEKGTVAEVFF